jgi:tetratricopeptide (TPR) repeat protein
LIIVASVISIALSAAFLGGEASEWGEAVPVIGIGLLLFVFPFKALPNNAVLIGLIGLLLCGLLGFLPARWLGEPEWHAALRQAIPGLANTVSLQPLHSLFRIGVMLSVVLFTVWVVQWQPVDCAYCFQGLTAGIALLATVALAAGPCAFSVPGWYPSQGFGPFANRNQTGTLMALGAMLALGLFASAARRRNWAVVVWLLAFIVCLVALLFSNSRAPFCLLALGTFLWLSRREKTPLKAVAIAGGVASLICAAALLIGQGVAKRLPDLLSHDAGFRVEIYQDALRLAGTAPVGGIGIGNFEAIFPLFREVSVNDQRVIHPESDWLWMASEMGWFSVLFCALAVGGVLIRRVRPATRGQKDMQFAGLIALAAFLVNSLFDVPGHRLGTILPALVLAGICTRSKLSWEGARAISWTSRISGIVLVAIGFVLLGEANLKTQTQLAMSERMEEAASESLVRTPLSWSLYVIRGYANVHQGKWLQAIADFRHALVLEPKLAIVPFNEGRAWVSLNSALALSAWKEALRRSLPQERDDLYGQMLDASLGDIALHSATLRLADGEASLAITALRSGHADSKTLQVLETEKSELNVDQIQAVLRAEAWLAAAERDFKKAYELGRQGMHRVSFPVQSQQSEEQCRDALIRDPRDFGAVFNLCSILRTKQRWQEALQILELTSKDRDCPDYFRVMRAEILASQSQWSESWDAIAGLVK